MLPSKPAATHGVLKPLLMTILGRFLLLPTTSLISQAAKETKAKLEELERKSKRRRITPSPSNSISLKRLRAMHRPYPNCKLVKLTREQTTICGKMPFKCKKLTKRKPILLARYIFCLDLNLQILTVSRLSSPRTRQRTGQRRKRKFSSRSTPVSTVQTVAAVVADEDAVEIVEIVEDDLLVDVAEQAEAASTVVTNPSTSMTKRLSPLSHKPNSISPNILTQSVTCLAKVKGMSVPNYCSISISLSLLHPCTYPCPLIPPISTSS